MLVKAKDAIDDKRDEGSSEDDEDEKKANRYIFHGYEAGEEAEPGGLVRVLCYFLPDKYKDCR